MLSSSYSVTYDYDIEFCDRCPNRVTIDAVLIDTHKYNFIALFLHVCVLYCSYATFNCKSIQQNLLHQHIH